MHIRCCCPVLLTHRTCFCPTLPSKIERLQAFLALNASQLEAEKSELQKDRQAFKAAMEQYTATLPNHCPLTEGGEPLSMLCVRQRGCVCGAGCVPVVQKSVAS